MSSSTADGWPGGLVISLDFELQWGVRDKLTPNSPYLDNLHGARRVIPCLLDLFREFEVAATWATVGFLFANSREELNRFTPSRRPQYRNAKLSPYGDQLGDGETDDPLHFAPSLISAIIETPRQEIATHTFSHYLCCEAGQSPDEFRSDLQAACAIAGERSITLRSIVFPRNQHNSNYDGILLEHGIRSYRGNPRGWTWRFGSAEESAARLRRAGRLLDSYVNLTGDNTFSWSEVLQPNGLSDVRASFLLRPHNFRLRTLEPLRLRRLRASLRNAARSHRLLHLWWHPHNFGVDQEANLTFLRRILEELQVCREQYGMLSLSMTDVDRMVRSA